MHSHKTTWPLIAFVSAFLVVGVPYWQIPYREASLPSTLMRPGLLVVGAAALLLRAGGAARFWTATIVAAFAVPAAVFARVSVETQRDPSSHNLWPLEILIALVLGVLPALSGAIVGSMFATLTAAPAARDPSNRP